MTLKQYKIDINIVDDHIMFAESLAQTLNNMDAIRVSRTFKTLDTCKQSLCEQRPDVLLLDISMPDGNGITFCEEILKEYPKMKVIVITVHDEYSIIKRMLKLGVHGYLLKSSPIDELVKAIQSVWQGGHYIGPDVETIINQSEKNAVYLTDVERSILRLICEGNTNPQIAALLHLSTETVNWYRKRLLAKFGAKNAVQLVNIVLKENTFADT